VALFAEFVSPTRPAVKAVLRLVALAGPLFFTGATAKAAAETYEIDPAQSTVSFSIRHFVGKAEGRFAKFSGRVVVDRDHWEQSSTEATIEAASIDTKSAKRDAHLRSTDFFDATRFPTIAFVSRSWKQTGAGTFAVSGDLTMKDVTRGIVLEVRLLGFGDDKRGANVSRWEGTTTINTADFHVKDPPLLDATIGDEVTITVKVEAVRTKT
jgi:polyisoprenoid-binding protein YceI